MNKHVYDLIIGVKTMTKHGVILIFFTKELVIDKISQPMKPLESLMDAKVLNDFHRDHLEPISTREETKHTIEILDAKYEQANLAEVLEENRSHLSSLQRNMMLKLLTKYKELLDGTLSDFNTNPVSFKLKKDEKTYHGRTYPIPHSPLNLFKKEVEQLCKL